MALRGSKRFCEGSGPMLVTLGSCWNRKDQMYIKSCPHILIREKMSAIFLPAMQGPEVAAPMFWCLASLSAGEPPCPKNSSFRAGTLGGVYHCLSSRYATLASECDEQT